jgi:peptidoglycan-associated lipoprotein
MKPFYRAAVLTIATLSLGLGGCHHAAKMPQPALPEAKPAAPAPTPKVETPPPAAAPEEFKPVDMDAEARQALQTVYFDFDKYDLRSDAVASLGVAAKFLQEHASFRVLAQGNCDERGSEEYNLGLGERRAKAVKKYLTSYGIAADRIETTSYGKEQLARTGCAPDDDPCNQANRRVEWKVLAK